MIVKLTEAEKIAIANHLAEKSTAEHVVLITGHGLKATDSEIEGIRKDYFKFFKQCLDETDDY